MVVFYTGNEGKVKELRLLFSQSGIDIVSANAIGIDTGIPETGLTFVENALIKARHGALQAQQGCIADDSGLLVDALSGQPGVKSARFSGEKATHTENLSHLLNCLVDVETAERTATFICCLVFLRHADDPCPLIAFGSLSGLIAKKPTGRGGFGYDPVFYLPTHNKTLAELSAVEKNTISHRALASHELLRQFSLRRADDTGYDL